MKILAIEKPVRGTTDKQCAPYLIAEAAQVWNLYLSGIVREFYFRKGRNEAVLVLECRTTAHAHRVLKSLPLVRKRLIDFDLIPLRAYPGFERLFATAAKR